MKDLSGQTIGNYRIETRLGAGGMGTVYRAHHLHLERVVAIKVLHDHFALAPSFRARFRQEANTRIALHHPNITEVFDFGEEMGGFYLVMELITAGSVRTLLQRYAQKEQVPPLALSLDLVGQAAGALAYAHARGVVHRDIKPDNLLLAQGKTADSYVVKISDFDLARLAQAEGMTPTGETRGTPAYMSPEQCQGVDLDGRSDLYSLGIVLYELATGYLPFQIKNISEAVHRHIYTKPRSPRDVRSDLPQELVDLILRCLEKNPQQRFASADDFMTALQRIRVDSAKPAPSPPMSDPEPQSHQSSRKTGRISVKLERDSVILTPGQPTTVRVRVDNLGDTVDHLTVTIDGVPEYWVQGSTQTVQLNPTEQTTVACIVQPPRSPESRAGEYPVVVRAHSRENPSEYGNASARWTVLPFTASAVELTPTRASGRREATYGVTLRNDGNAGARYTLSGKDEEQALAFRFDQDHVPVEPGQAVEIKLTLRAPWRWVGSALVRGIQVSATAGTEARTARDGGPAPQVAAGQFVHRALISSWVPPVLLALLVVAFFGLRGENPGPDGGTDTVPKRPIKEQKVENPPPSVKVKGPEPKRVYSQGQLIIRGTWSYDLDVGTQISDGGRADFWWEQVTDVERYLVPMNGAKFFVVGIRDFESVGYADLQRFNYSSQKINGSNETYNQIPQGTLVAYETKEGNLGKFKVEQYGYNLTIQWVTFAK